MKNTFLCRSNVEPESNTSRPLSDLFDMAITIPLTRSAFVRSKLLRLSSGMLCTLLSVGPAYAQLTSGDSSEVEPDINAPWPDAVKKGLWPKGVPVETSQPAPSPKPAVEPAKTTDQSPPTSSETSTAAKPMIPQTKPRKHEIAFSADYFLGQGDVTLPVFFALGQNPAIPLNPFTPTVLEPDRDSTYYGGTISYSYQYAWYIDLSYQHGNSSGSVDLDYLSGFAPLPSNFTIEDNWYQAYVRYAFPGLRGKRLSAYLRAGISYVEAEMTDETTIPNVGSYSQSDETKDLLGNLGFGVGYSVYTTRRMRLALQLEGEGFFGTRSQQSTETLQNLPGSSTADIDNTLYGGIGRATIKFEYRLGESGFFRVFADVGLQGKITEISYPDVPNYSGQTYSELLWGPYAKIGMRYSF
jgi:hypothetical protein